MVQKKAPDRPSSQVESRQNHVKSERRPLSSHQHRDIRNKGGSDLKKKMKKSRSTKVSDLESLGSPRGCQYLHANKPLLCKKPSPVKISDGLPNYMKPTSSWDARKEQFQVRVHSPTTADKNQSPKNSNNSNRLKPSSSVSGLRPAKVLSRKSSLKPVRPLMKKSSGIPLFPKINVTRATCSSTMKDTKFPNALELNRGGTESEGTSVLKVCPFTYCSLNGHRHEPLPPLKCFLSARRRLLKHQKSMKLTGQSSKGKKEIDTGQMTLDRVPSVSVISPLIDEVGNDFFVEIYAKLQAEITESVNDDEGSNKEGHGGGNPEVLTEISSIGDGKMGVETETEEHGRIDINSLLDESYSEISLEDNLDQNSDLSTTDMEVPMDFVEYIECDHEVEPRDISGNPPCSTQDYVEWSFECCMLSDSGKISDGFRENKSNETVFEATDMDWEEDVAPFRDDGTEYSEFPEYGIDPSLISLHGDEDTDGELSLELPNNVIACEESSLDTVPDLEPNDEGKNLEVGCPIEASAVTNSLIQNQLTDDSDQNSKSIESSEVFEQGCMLEMEGYNPSSISNITEARDTKSEHFLENSPVKEDNNEDVFGVLVDQAFEPVDLETTENMATSKECLDCYLISDDNEGQNGNDKVEDANKLIEIQLSDYHQDLSETDDNITTEIKLEVFVFDDATIDPSHPSEFPNCSMDYQSDFGNSEENREKSENDQCKEFSETGTNTSKSTNEDDREIRNAMQIEGDNRSNADETNPAASFKCSEDGTAIISEASNTNQPLPETDRNLKTRANNRKNRGNEDLEELRPFNPRAPRFLPAEPDPEAEKVDLRHQMMDERKSAEEWMIDYALQQAITKLAPARKRKVALLVEAFETVMPLPMCEKPLPHGTVDFGHVRPMQACS